MERGSFCCFFFFLNFILFGFTFSLTFHEKQKEVQKLIRQLKHDGILPEDVSFDSQFFATRNAYHVSMKTITSDCLR